MRDALSISSPHRKVNTRIAFVAFTSCARRIPLKPRVSLRRRWRCGRVFHRDILTVTSQQCIRSEISDNHECDCRSRTAAGTPLFGGRNARDRRMPTKSISMLMIPNPNLTSIVDHSLVNFSRIDLTRVVRRFFLDDHASAFRCILRVPRFYGDSLIKAVGLWFILNLD